MIGTMIYRRPAGERGRANFGWLDSKHSFSFGEYYDPRFMGFRTLRVINEDKVLPGHGFPTHPHRDMEIISYVIEGELEHRDSMGTGSVIRRGDVQRMSAGTGVLHSEMNPSRTKGVHFLQIWLLPESKGIQPSYEQKFFDDASKQNTLRVVASRDARDGAVKIHQDVELYAGLLASGASLTHTLRPGRHAWVQMVKGAATLNGVALGQGDGVALSEEPAVELTATEDVEVLLFDMA